MIDAPGTSEKPITFTSVKNGSGMTPARRDWGGIGLYKGEEIDGCTFSYSGNGDGAALALGTTTNTTVTNCTFAHNVYGIDASGIGTGTVVSGSTFSDNSSGDSYAPCPPRRAGPRSIRPGITDESAHP